MDRDVQAGPVRWSSVQAYAFAAVCLVIGVVCGYLLHPPMKSSVAAAPPTQAVEQNAPVQSAPMPSPEQMKHMGNKMAEPLLEQLKSDPNNAEVLAKVGSVYFRSGQFPQAAEYYEKSVKAKPTANGYVSLSNAYHYAGQDDQAIAMLNQALQVDPKSADALFNLGMLNWRVKNDPKAAIDDWERLIKSNPKHPKRAQVEGMIAKAKQHLSMPDAKEN